MHCHPLVEGAYMLHQGCSTIIHDECGLSEPPTESHSFNSTRERWFGNLVERSAHHIISQAFRGWATVSAFMEIVLIIWEGLTMRCPWPGSITIILLIVRREVKVRRSSPSPFVAQLSLQMINL